MEKVSYFAVFEKSDDGYSVYFPDIPGCVSWGENIAEAQQNAREALELHLYGIEQDGEAFPKPSENVKSGSLEDVVVLVSAFPELFKEQYENKKVRINVTISNKLKQIAQAEKINCSQVLETALKSMLENSF